MNQPRTATVASPITPGIALWKAAWHTFEDHVGPIFGMTAITIAGVLGIGAVAAGCVAAIIYGMVQLETATIGLISTAIIVGIALVVVMIVASLTLLTAQFFFLNALAAGKPEQIGAALRRGWKLFPGFFWVNLLGGLATVAGLVVFIIPGIIIGLRLAFVTFVYINEGIRGSAALRRSWELTRGISWIVLARMYVFVLGMIVGGIAQLIPIIGSLIIGPFVVNPLQFLWMAHFYQNISAVKAANPTYTDAYSTAQKIGLVAVVGAIGALSIGLQLMVFGVFGGRTSSEFFGDENTYRYEYEHAARFQFPGEELESTNSFDDAGPIELKQE